MRNQRNLPVRLQKDLLRPWLLLMLAGRPGYGYDLRRELLDRGFHVEASSVYRGLREMEEQGLIDSQWTTDSGGPDRRVYALTEEGRTELEESAATLARARRAQSAFLRAHRETLE